MRRPSTEMTPETWCRIPGHPRHEVSDLGRVRLAVRGHFSPAGTLLAQKRERNGYWRVALCSGGKATYHLVSRLVLLAFVGPPPQPDWQAAHCDGDQSNNALTNLRWATPTENNRDRRVHGTMPVGERHAGARLTEAKVREIRELRSSGLSYSRIAQEAGLYDSIVAKVCRRETWGHVA